MISPGAKEKIEELVFDTIEELVILRIQLGDNEEESVRENIKNAQLNIFSISQIVRNGLEGKP